jgi:hypothetical protein
MSGGLLECASTCQRSPEGHQVTSRVDLPLPLRYHGPSYRCSVYLSVAVCYQVSGELAVYRFRRDQTNTYLCGRRWFRRRILGR